MTTIFKKRKISIPCGSHDVEAIESHQVDRISDLPECVTSHILSRLPTKDAMRTCVLSRDWKYKWTFIYNIYITDMAEESDSSIDERGGALLEEEDRVARFTRYVDKIVHSTHNLRIRRFSIHLRGKFDDSHHLRTWMCEILNRGVQNLSIVTRNRHSNIELPTCFESQTSLTQLKLKLNCTLEIRNFNSFPMLKILYLSGTRGGNFHIVNKQSTETGHLSLTFPVLKKLELSNFRFLSVKSVEINVPELVRFRNWESRNYATIKIVAPKLIEFGVVEIKNYDLCAPSLRYVHLMGGDASHATTFLKGVPCLKHLSITGSIAKAILQWKGVNTLPCLKRLQELKVRSSSTEELFELLHLTPNLRLLILSRVWGYQNHGTLQELLPPCIVSLLKRVTIFSFNGESDQISLANLFLEKARKLKKVLVYLEKGLSMTDEKIDRWLMTLGPESSMRLRIVEELT